MPRNDRQHVHGINCNSNNISLPKRERAKIRTAVFKCEVMYSNEQNTVEYTKKYNSTMGRVNRLKNLHPKEYQKLYERLIKIKV